MEYIDNVYVINMDRSSDRLQLISENMRKLNIPFTRINAVDGQKLSESEIKNQTTLLCSYFCTLAMIGIFLSHKKTWETIVQNNDKYAIVMEDDCELIDTFKTDLKIIMDELILHNPDFIYLGCMGDCNYNNDIVLEPMALFNKFMLPRLTKSSSNELKYSFVPRSPLGFHCYIISNDCAKRLLEIMNKVDNHVDFSFLKIGNDFNIFASKKNIGNQFGSADQTTQISCTFPITLNSISKNFSYHNMAYSYYLTVPMFQILGHPVNPYLIIVCLIAIFTSNINILIKGFFIFFILEFILEPKNASIILFWGIIIYSIIYARHKYK
jgi:GR25 family glycosyltransferase involved in LPS biosynthesis